MSKILKLTLFIILVSFFAPETAGICKWVDADGVVHFAEECPEEANGADIQIHEPPPQEQVDAYTKRSEKIRDDTQARKNVRQKDKEQQVTERETREETKDSNNEMCAQARWNLEILRTASPVYFDEEHSLHYNRSLHDLWYAGNRTYLDDSQRQSEIARYTSVETRACTTAEADIRARIMKYQENSHNEMCEHLRNKLQLMQSAQTGIPSTKMRDLEILVETRCK